MNRINKQEHFLLAQIAKLSAIRDVEEFELTLLETLASVLSVDCVFMFKVYEIHEGFKCLSYQQKNNHKNIILQSCASEKLQHLRALPDSVQSARIILSDDNMIFQQEDHDIFRYYVLSEHNTESTAYLGFERNNKLGKKEKGLLTNLLIITKNFFDILEESQFDNLTGLLNRTTFDNNIFKIQQLHISTSQNTLDYEGENLRNDEDDSDFCLAMLDIDFFKKINDTFGHVYGDEVLLLLAQLMKKSFRAEDLLFRFGGEEFVIIIQVTDLGMANMILDRFRKTIEAYKFPQLKQVTVSIGATHLEKFYSLPENIIDRADKALYFAKEHGRNQLQFYETLIEEGHLEDNTKTGRLDIF